MLAREHEARQPVDQDRVGATDDIVEGAQRAHPRRGHRHPLRRRARGVLNRDAHPVRARRGVGEREAQIAPRRDLADVDRDHGADSGDLPVGLRAAELCDELLTRMEDTEAVDGRDIAGHRDGEQRLVVGAGRQCVPIRRQRARPTRAAEGTQHRSLRRRQAERQSHRGSVDTTRTLAAFRTALCRGVVGVGRLVGACGGAGALGAGRRRRSGCRGRVVVLGGVDGEPVGDAVRGETTGGTV